MHTSVLRRVASVDDDYTGQALFIIDPKCHTSNCARPAILLCDGLAEWTSIPIPLCGTCHDTFHEGRMQFSVGIVVGPWPLCLLLWMAGDKPYVVDVMFYDPAVK